MSKELDELKQTIKEHGLSEKYAVELRQMEMMEEQTAKLEKANAEMRESLAKMQEQRSIQDSLDTLLGDVSTLKTNAGKKPLTKEDILSIKEPAKRIRLIEENLHLFQGNNERREEIAQREAQEKSCWSALSRYGITKTNIQDMTERDILARVPAGFERVFALNHIIGK